MSSEVIYENTQAVRDCAVPPGCALRATRVRANYKSTDTADEQVESMTSLRASVASASVSMHACMYVCNDCMTSLRP